ncbi:glycosyltransferase [Stenotrophomonas maltophilia]|uniref:glycosyltransferase n=1 Tax=Stenotrophomonas maltophilia TaxID=40324 RepID=UPI0025E52B3F|nr:glycosyltransferase [uncultured Stenotrophomonas sp.]
MIGVLIPAHNEADSIVRCLQSIRVAAQHPGLGGEAVEVVVALDACSDATGAICHQLRVCCVQLDARCVGVARAAAAAELLGRGARWLASTDADSEVPPDWLAAQVQGRSDAFCGLVDIATTSQGERRLRTVFQSRQQWGDDHGRIHGANLGVSAHFYRVAGGFAPLSCSEDVAFVRALQRCGAVVRWARDPVVMTSARLQGRATGGFSAYLAALGGARYAAEVSALNT